MNNTKTSYFLQALMVAGLAVGAMSAQAAVDVAGAKAALKANRCAKCHSVDKEKTGPSYKKVAEKYKGKADAEAKLYIHLTTAPKIKVDGEEEEHVKAKGDEATIKSMVQYILSL